MKDKLVMWGLIFSVFGFLLTVPFTLSVLEMPFLLDILFNLFYGSKGLQIFLLLILPHILLGIGFICALYCLVRREDLDGKIFAIITIVLSVVTSLWLSVMTIGASGS